MVLDATLLNAQDYNVSFKDKIEQSREGVAPSSTPLAIEKGALGSPSTKVFNFTFFT